MKRPFISVLILGLLLPTLVAQVPFPVGFFGGNAGSAGANAVWNTLVAHWKFDETGQVTRVDNKASINLTVGPHTAPNSTAGLIGNAINNVRSSGQGLTAADNATMSFTGSFTISFWVKFNSTNSYSPLVMKGTINTATASLVEYTVWLDANFQQFRFDVSNGSVINHVLCAALPSAGNGQPSTGVWYQVVCRHRNGTNIGIQVNETGSQGSESTTSFTTGVADGTNATFVGTENSDSFYLDGLMDELSYFNSALSSGDVTTLWNSGAGLTYP